MEQEQRSRLRVYRRCLLGEGGPWELLKQAKKPLPWLNLTQTHFLVFHYHLALPILLLPFIFDGDDVDNVADDVDV